jgi:colanic acid/amylovoran biosynthesis glycosyltransferase
MNAQHPNIAYLAPEIPALSATFVTGEIFKIEQLGLRVLPVSVHRPAVAARGPAEDELAARTYYLYETPKVDMLRAFLALYRRASGTTLRAVLSASADACRPGLTLRTRPGLLYRFAAAGRLARLLQCNGCRHLHAHFAHIPTDLAMYAARLAGISFSFTCHANDLFQRGWLLRRKVERARFTVAISDYNRTFLISRGALPQAIHVIHCGVDGKKFSPDFSSRASAVPRIGTLGRLVEKKGVDVLLRACATLQQRGIPFLLDIAGDGPDGPMLKTLCAHFGLLDRVTFSGSLSHSRVAGWMNSLDVFVLACRRDSSGDMDGIPVVLMEAMAGGTAVVSTRITGIPELIIDGVCGRIAEPEDPEDLACAIAEVLGDTQQRERYRRAAAARVSAEFNLHTNTEKLSQLFREALS